MPDAPICSTCGQRHQRTVTGGQRCKPGSPQPAEVNLGLRPTCSGHVTHDRDGYVKGQDRPLLDKPRACMRFRPTDAGPAWKCESHGGGAGQVKAAQDRRQAEAKAEKIMRRFGGPVDVSATEALLNTVKWTAGYVGWLRERVAELESDGAIIEDGEHPWVRVLGKWHDRLVKVCSDAISAGIEERRVRIAEQQGALVADVIRKILSDLGLTPEQADKAGEVVPFRLRELAS